MKIQKTALAFLTALAAFAAPLQAVDTTIIHPFAGGTNDGAAPNGTPTLVGNTFYGLTVGGGAYGNGTIFRVNTDGTGFAILHSFKDGVDGNAPRNSLVVSGNTLYGLVGIYGGATRIFKINLDGSNYVNYELDSGVIGYGGQGNLTVDGNILYGLTGRGAGHDNGSVFAIRTDFAAPVNLHSFDGGDGGQAYGSVIPVGSTLYGMAQSTIFKVDTNGTGFQVLHHFAGAPGDGDQGRGSLTLVGSKLYGMTREGGAANFGVIFSLNLDGSDYRILHQFYTVSGVYDGFNSEGGSLTLVGNTLYGMTSYGGSNPDGTPSGMGTIFRINPDGSGYQILHSFLGGNDGSAVLRGDLTPSADGLTLYGMTVGGGSGQYGTLFSIGIHPGFFNGEAELANNVNYLAFPNGNPFGYYSYLADPRYIYHFDLGYEYLFDANDGTGGIYLYDFASESFFYTSASPTFPFPYLYDFSLNATLYYFPDGRNAGHYTQNPRYFYNFQAGQIITK